MTTPLHWPCIGSLILRTLPAGALLLAVQPVDGHDHTPHWAGAEAGISIRVDGTLEVRGTGRAVVVVEVLNLTDGPGRLLSVALNRDGQNVTIDGAGAGLSPMASNAQAWRTAQEAMEAIMTSSPQSVRSLLEVQADSLEAIRLAASRRVLEPGMDLSGEWTVNVAYELDQELCTQSIPVVMHRWPVLPRGDAVAERWAWDSDSATWQLVQGTPRTRGDILWRAGDQHLHTTWSLDAHVLDGTEEGPAGYADAARAKDLDWIMITDHSNIHAWWFGEWFFTPEQHESARQEAAQYRSNEGWPVLYSQEMGLGQTGFWDLPSHMLVYPLDTFDAPYLENPSEGLIFGHAQCESEQTIINRINSNGCYGFIAHPFEEGSLSFSMWDWGNGATGWAGLELWSNAAGEFHEADVLSLNKWHTLLADIGPPWAGQLADRPGWPTRAPIGVGNSDAHAAGDIGNVFTYAQVGDVTPGTLREAFLSGRCVASDGPLITIDVNGAGIGEVAVLMEGRGLAVVRLETTEEFGPVNEYTFVLEAGGESIAEFPVADASGYAVEYVIETFDQFGGGTYLTAWAQRSDLSRLALTNPVWMQSSTECDVNGDGVVGIDDLLAIIAAWGPCEGCTADINWNGIVDVNDLLATLAVYGN